MYVLTLYVLVQNIQEEAIKLLQDLYERIEEDAEKCRGGGLVGTDAVRLGNHLALCLLQ